MLMLMKVVPVIVIAAKKLMTRRIRYGTKVMCQTQVYVGGAENLAGIITTYITCEKNLFNVLTDIIQISQKRLQKRIWKHEMILAYCSADNLPHPLNYQNRPTSTF